jgi:predicted nucleotidyltransferase
MNNISFDLSGKIESAYLDVISSVKRVADALHIPFFLVRATARDFILDYCYGIKTTRMTRDIDLGVEIADWNQFTELSEALIATGRIFETREKQRFLVGDVPVDIVPFGPVAGENKKIGWPPEHEIFMSMLGFAEAYEYSLSVRLSTEPELIIKIPTLAGLALMKLISWNDRYPERPKDAEDFLFIMHHHYDAGNTDRLYEEEIALLTAEGFDNQLAGIKLLGQDMARIADSATTMAIKEILDNETKDEGRYRLITDMVKAYGFRDRFDMILQHVKKLKAGFFQI